MEMEKKKVALFSLTDCQGCEFVVLQLGEKLLEVAKEVDFANFRLASSKKEDGPFFISFVDGAVTSSEEVEHLKWIRSNSKYLVALGSCAAWGGINALKNYFTNVNFPKEVYSRDFESFEAKPLSKYVKVDAFVLGCPINLEEFVFVLKALLEDKVPKLKLAPVCEDCKKNGIECVTKKGMFCLGPYTIGGCGAPCPAAGVPCFGCRGPLFNPNVVDAEKVLRDRFMHGGVLFTGLGYVLVEGESK